MSLRKFLLGEPVPDKNDPKYKERYERDKAAGEAFARFTGLTALSGWICRHANAHKVSFLVIVFGLVVFLFILNAFRMIRGFHSGKPSHGVAVELVDSAMRHRGERSIE